MMGDRREFDNPFPDYSSKEAEQFFNINTGQLCEPFKSELEKNVEKLLSKLEEALKSKEAPGTDVKQNNTIYTGICGIALMYLKLYERLNQPHFLVKAEILTKEAVKHLSGRTTFLCGDGGPLATYALVMHKRGQERETKESIKSLEKLAKDALSSKTPDEMLNGRAGYLYALLYVNKSIGTGTIKETLIKEIVHKIVESGENLAKEKRFRGKTDKQIAKLMYQWHDSFYFGAAHGVSGIFFMLMMLEDFSNDSHLFECVKESLEYLLSLQFPSGNFPSSLGNEKDRLVHWCHGAPGFIHMWLQAYKIYNDERFLKAAVDCGEVIWKRGLLRKGYGLCHGVAGNAYGFIALWQTTKNPKDLYRAVKFAQWIFDYGKHGSRIADRPYSLFEGMAGTIYFLADLLNPNEAKFPAFYL